MFAKVNLLEYQDVTARPFRLEKILRLTAVLLIVLMAGELLPGPVYAVAAGAASQFVSGKIAEEKQKEKSLTIMQDLRRKMNAVKPADFAALARAPETKIGRSILDEIGRLDRPIPTGQLIEWRADLHREPANGKLSKAQIGYYAQRQLWLGEYLLAVDQSPREAATYFRSAYGLTPASDPYHGQAIYDLGLAVYYQHNFRATVDYYHHAMRLRPVPVGFDCDDAALMLRHAAACYGYHQDNSRRGIPEPPVLDQYCGAAALASSLQSLQLAYDRPSLLRNCKVTEEGSTLQDLIDAGHKLGVSVYAISADESGLQLMPKPAIAFVESDHFISVVRADKKGVGYLCSDCGAWPGGEVDLTWSQWRQMEPGVYGVVVRHGSNWDQFFKQLPYLKEHKPGLHELAESLANARQFHPGVEVASSAAANVQVQLASVASRLLPVTELVAHLSILGSSPESTTCGESLEATHCCLPCGTCPFADEAGYVLNSLLNVATTALFDGPSNGDPVNLATGEEEYTPADDLSVYNPIGPSVSWGRVYNSLRAPYSEPWYEFLDYGQGWSQNYNMGVYDPTKGAIGNRSIFLPNGGLVSFTAPSVPTAATPTVACQVQNGFKYLVTWNYNAANQTTYYMIEDGDRTQYITTPLTSGAICLLSQIVDPTGHSINFNYGAPNPGPDYFSTQSWPLLVSITDSENDPLLVINRSEDGTGAIASVSDRYGRTVYYHVGFYHNVGVQPGVPQDIYACDHVSQIVPTSSAFVGGSPPDRYHYGYTLVSNEDGAEETPKLASISVPNPSPTGPSMSTATIQYAADSTVASITDANNNQVSFESVSQSGVPTADTNYEQVTVTGANLPQAYSYIVGNNNVFAETGETDGAGNQIVQKVFADANNPYSPTSVTNANQETWNYTYTTKGFGDLATAVTPRTVTTTYTWNYSNFALGELDQVQESSPTGAKSPTSFTYNEPSGLIATVTKPAPGTSDSQSEVRYQYSYDAFGDVTAVTSPGNGTASSITDTFMYGGIGLVTCGMERP